MWYLNDDTATPSPPPIIPPLRQRADPKRQHSGSRTKESLAKRFPPGCWLVQLVPRYADDNDPNLAFYPVLKAWDLRYVGTLRVEACAADTAPDKTVKPGSLRASGDLYVQRHLWSEAGPPMPPALPPPAPPVEVPIFPRQDYSFYFTVQSVELVGDDGVRLELASFHFDASKNAWNQAPILTALLHEAKAEEIPPTWTTPLRGPYLVGDVVNHPGTTVAHLEIGWISRYLREASIAIAAAPGLTAPTANGQGDDLKSVFEKLNWKLNVLAPITAQVSDEVWEEKQLESFMTKLEAPVDFDKVWTYSALVVPRFQDAAVFGFGKMYDGGAIDTDLVPREGILVAADSEFPADPRYGTASGQMLKNVPQAAFCVFMHELGHAMGLLHRFTGNGFMQELVFFAGRNPPFPDNLPVRYNLLLRLA